MPRPRGSLKKQPDGRFVARYSAGTDPLTGKRLQHWRTFDTQRDAQRWLTAELSAFDAGKRAARHGGPKLATFLRDYYAKDRRSKNRSLLAPQTCEVDLNMVERYLVTRAPSLAETPIGHITTSQLDAWTRSLAEGDREHRGLAKATVSRMHRIVGARLAHAVKVGLIRESPMKGYLVPVSGKEARDKVTLRAEHARALLAVCHTDRYGALFALLVWTGLRPSEGLGLTWADVDWHTDTLVIRRALVRTKKDVALRETKNRRVRRVALTTDMVALLRQHERQQAAEKAEAGAAYEDIGLVFATRCGKPEHKDNVARRHLKPLLLRAAYHLAGKQPPAVPAPSRAKRYREALHEREQSDKAALQAAGFPNVSMMGLRHTHATLLLEANVHPKVAAERLGHSTTRTTLDTYSHVAPHMQQQANDALAATLAAPGRFLAQPQPGMRP